MTINEALIEKLFKKFAAIRYVAIYSEEILTYKQKEQTSDSSSSDSDKYEELLVNPTLLKLATQRGNIDCGGLNYLVVAYGNFFQLIKATTKGHISICLEKSANINELPSNIIEFLKSNFLLFTD